MYSKTKQVIIAISSAVFDGSHYQKCPKNKQRKVTVLGLLIAVCVVSVRGHSAISRHPIDPEMVFVKGGTFQMGCTSEQGKDCRDNERPQHRVTISSFYISKYQVTRGQWRLIMGKDASGEKRDDYYPVEDVSWNDAQEFIRLLNFKTRKKFRLPTEAEWEYAARGGIKSKGYKYSGSNYLADVAWFDEDGKSLKHVGLKQPNELGISDMSGNVWEWCGDWAGEYPASPQSNPVGAATGSFRVLRGGGWFSEARQCTVTYRSWSRPGNRYGFGHGFRLAHP